MPKVLERPDTNVDVRPDVDVAPEVPVDEPVIIPPRPPMPSEPARFVRWLGWLAVVVMVIGAGFLTWNVITDDAVVVDATAGISSQDMDMIRRATTGYGTIAAVDLLTPQARAYLTAERSFADFTAQELQARAYLTAERSFADTALELQYLPAVAADPLALTQQELVRRATSGYGDPAIASVDPLAFTQQELLRRATSGYDLAPSWSSQTRDLLRSMPPGSGPAVGEAQGWSLQTLELLRSMSMTP